MTRKLDKEHVDAIRDIQNRFAQNAGWIGTVNIEIKMLEQRIAAEQRRLDELYHQHEQLQEQESALLTTLKARYGEGEINIEQGIFTPAG
jgi:outer membrane translocation and assembly module TamA